MIVSENSAQELFARHEEYQEAFLNNGYEAYKEIFTSPVCVLMGDRLDLRDDLRDDRDLYDLRNDLDLRDRLDKCDAASKSGNGASERDGVDDDMDYDDDMYDDMDYDVDGG